MGSHSRIRWHSPCRRNSDFCRAIGVWTIALLLAIASGCNSPLFRPKHPGLVAIGKYKACQERLVTLLNSVQNAESALHAAPQLGPAFAATSQSLQEMAKRLGPSDKFFGTPTELREFEKLQSDTQEGSNVLKANLDRLNSMPGLPPEFWDAFRVASLDAAVAVFEMNLPGLHESVDSNAITAIRSGRQMFTDHTPRKVVEFELTEPSAHLDEFLEAVRTHYRGGVTVVGGPRSYVGPITDFNEFKQVALKYGLVARADEARNFLELKITMHPSSSPVSGNATPSHAAPTGAFPSRTFPDSPSSSSPSPSTAGGEGGTGFDSPNSTDPPGPPAPRPSLPVVNRTRVERLVDQMKSGSFFDAGDAIRTLNQLNVDDVTADERRLIAQAFRTEALGDRVGSNLDRLVEGLIHWGGQYAGPVLVEVMETQRFDVPQELWDHLAANPTPDIAMAVARQLTDFRKQRAAYGCLDRMGAAGEAAMKAAVESEDPEICMAGIQLLAKHGSSDVLRLLGQAQRSRNPRVREAAKQAMTMIRERENAGGDQKKGKEKE